jgi:hypothetical protein
MIKWDLPLSKMIFLNTVLGDKLNIFGAPIYARRKARHVQPVSAALTLTLYLVIYSIALWYLRPTAMAPGKKKLHSALNIARDV